MDKRKKLRIGVLALQGDVREHAAAILQAAKSLKLDVQVIEVRTADQLDGISGIILPGAESTVLWKLLVRENMLEAVAAVPNIFGTCAGLILMAKNILDGVPGQGSLKVLDIDVQRNAYGPQAESFETEAKTSLGKVKAAFIRAPLIKRIGKDVQAIAELDGQIVGVSQILDSNGRKRFMLGLAFHPEIERETGFHELFLKKAASL